MQEGRADTLAFALAYIITHSVFLTAFGPLHQQLRTTSPMIPAIMAIVYLVAIIILLKEVFGLFGKIGGGSDSGIGGSVGGTAPSSISRGSGPGTKAGDGGTLRVNILGPRDGSFAPLGGRGVLAFEIAGGQKPLVWNVQPPTYVKQAQGRTGWGNVIKTDLVAPMPGKQTITVTATDASGQNASATVGYTVVAGGTISGKVIDKGNAPLGSVTVYLGAPGNTSVLRGSTGKVELTAKTKDDGSFKFEDVPFGTALQIRATTSTHEGLVKVPQTGWEKSTFALNLEMPVIENCVVIFPEYEYKKPSVKIKKIDGVAVANKDYNTAISAKKALDVEIEVDPGNALAIKDKNDLGEMAKKLKLLCVYTAENGVQYQVPFGVKTAADKLAITIKDDKWTCMCELTFGDRLPILPYGEYRVYVTLEDDRKTAAKEEARFMVMQGMGFGSTNAEFRIAVESINGTVVPPMTDRIPTQVPGGDIGVIKAMIEGGVPIIEGYCVITLVATIVESKKIKVREKTKLDIKEFEDWVEGQPQEYSFGKISTPKAQAVQSGAQHELTVTADFKQLRNRVPRNETTETSKKIVMNVKLIVQTFAEDSSNPKKSTGNVCLITPVDFYGGGDNGRDGSDDPSGKGKPNGSEVIITIIDRSNPAMGSDNKREAPFDMVIDILDENGGPAKNLDDGIMITPIHQGQSTDDVRFPNAAPFGIGRKLRVKLSKRNGSVLGETLAVVDITTPSDPNRTNVQVVFTYTGKNFTSRVS